MMTKWWVHHVDHRALTTFSKINNDPGFDAIVEENDCRRLDFFSFLFPGCLLSGLMRTKIWGVTDLSVSQSRHPAVVWFPLNTSRRSPAWRRRDSCLQRSVVQPPSQFVSNMRPCTSWLIVVSSFFGVWVIGSPCSLLHILFSVVSFGG